MERDLHTPLWQAAASTFEHLGFLLAEPEESEGREEGAEVSSEPGADEAADPLGGAPGARVRFSGPVEGEVELWLSREVAEQVGSTLLALPVPLEDSLVADTLGELSNVICGNLLPALRGEDAEYRLSPPAPWTAATPEAPAETVVARAAMRLGPGHALVRLHLDEAVEAVGR